MRCPVILSIATLRYWNRECGIVVVDASGHPNDWGEYPELLNFSVMRASNFLIIPEVTYDYLSDPHTIIKFLCRPYNSYKASLAQRERFIAAVDTDIFWIKDPLPFCKNPSERFCINRNSGYYYYDKHNPNTKRTIEIWSSLGISSLYEKDLREGIRNSYKTPFLHDEAVISYIHDHYSEFVQKIPICENMHFSEWVYGRADISSVKNLHIHSNNLNVCNGNRGFACMYLKELKAIINYILGPDRLEVIFGDFDVEPVSIYDRDSLIRLHEIKQ